jgi:hypothetical protein
MQHQRRMGDEQDFPVHRRVLQMFDDVSDHPVAGPAVDRSDAYLRRQTGEIGQGLIDQENTRLADENFLAQSRQTMGVAPGGVRLRTPARAIYVIQNQIYTPVQKEKPARAGGHLAGFSTGVFAQSGLA